MSFPSPFPFLLLLSFSIFQICNSNPRLCFFSPPLPLPSRSPQIVLAQVSLGAVRAHVVAASKDARRMRHGRRRNGRRRGRRGGGGGSGRGGRGGGRGGGCRLKSFPADFAHQTLGNIGVRKRCSISPLLLLVCMLILLLLLFLLLLVVAVGRRRIAAALLRRHAGSGGDVW